MDMGFTSRISDNTANGGLGSGGGIFNDGGDCVNVINVNVKDNVPDNVAGDVGTCPPPP